MCTNRLAERESRPDEGASSSKELTSSQNNKEEIKSGESSTESDDEVSLELECRENIDEEDVESVILEDEDLESKVFPQQRFSPLLTPKTLTSKRSRTPDLGKVRHSPIPFSSRRAITPDMCHLARTVQSGPNNFKAACTSINAKQPKTIQVLPNAASQSKQNCKTVNKPSQIFTDSKSSGMFVKPSNMIPSCKPGLTISGSFQPKGSVFKPSIPTQQLPKGKTSRIANSASQLPADEEDDRHSSATTAVSPSCPVSVDAPVTACGSVSCQKTTPCPKSLMETQTSNYQTRSKENINGHSPITSSQSSGSANNSNIGSQEQMLPEASFSTSRYQNISPFYAPLNIASHIPCYQAPLSPLLSPGTSSVQVKSSVPGTSNKSSSLPLIQQMPAISKASSSNSRVLLPAPKSVLQSTPNMQQGLAPLQGSSVPLAPRPLSVDQQWHPGLTCYSVVSQFVGDPQQSTANAPSSPQLLSKGQLKSFQGTPLAIYNPVKVSQQKPIQAVLSPKITPPGSNDQTQRGQTMSYLQPNPINQPVLTNISCKPLEAKSVPENTEKGETVSVQQGLTLVCESSEAQLTDSPSPQQCSVKSCDSSPIANKDPTPGSSGTTERDTPCAVDKDKSQKAKTILKRFLPDGMEQ